MPRISLALLLVVSLLKVAAPAAAADREANAKADRIEVGPADWPWWRGPNRDGVATSDQKPPLRWSETENVVWKTAVPGRGHGSATVVGDQVFLATCDEEEETQSVLCFDRKTGSQVWKTDVHRGNIEKKENKKSSQASATVACDGERLFITFQNSKAIYLTALSRAGKQLWQKKVSDFVTNQGYGASPAVYKSLVLVSADHKGGGKLAAFDRATGELVWSHERPKIPNYTSPVIVNAVGREQLVFTGCKLVSSFDPLTGKPLWEVAGATEECVTSTVTDGNVIFTSGGYPKNHLSAVRADGSGELVWEKPVRVYVPSMLVRNGYLYAVADEGIALCWKTDTGKEMWKQRLDGTFTASPVMVGENIFATNEAGRTFIFKARPEGFEKVAENQLGDEVYPTPTICGSRIYMRVASNKDGKRQETLYCLGIRE
jgi:outer membrane protein assembly factor BamB